MIEPVVAIIGAVMFLAGLIVGAHWRLSRRPRHRVVALPDEWR